MKKRKIMGLVMAASIATNMVFANVAHADNISTYNVTKSEVKSDVAIIGQATGTVQQMENWARSKGATETFVSLAKKYYNLAGAHGGINPVMAYAQSGLETGFGHFGGVINESYNNPCGMKTREGGSNTDPNAHMRFSSWDEGIKAHLDHLALYAGAPGYPRANTNDPRHFDFIFGKAKTVGQLAGNWASDSAYSNKILNLISQIHNAPGGDNKPTPPVNPEKPVVNTKTGYVTASVLNVRSGKGTGYSRIGSLRNGAKVIIVESSNGWHKIKYGNGYGYVSDDYIRLSGGENIETPPTKPDTTSKTGVVTASRLNIRSGRGTNNRVIGYLNRGVSVQIIDTANGWHKIKTGNGYGYISADYVSVKNTGEQNQGKSGTVTANSLNVRSGRGTSYRRIGGLSRGTKVSIVDTTNGWHKIKYGSGHGYVSAQYIR